MDGIACKIVTEFNDHLSYNKRFVYNFKNLENSSKIHTIYESRVILHLSSLGRKVMNSKCIHIVLCQQCGEQPTKTTRSLRLVCPEQDTEVPFESVGILH